MPDFDHWKEPTKDFIRDVQHYWLHEYHIDGLRYDASAYIGWDIYNGVSQIVWSARQSKPWAYLIAEHLPKDPALIFKTELNAQWDDTFHHQMKATLREGVFNDVFRAEDLARLAQAFGYAAEGFGSSEHLIKYVENHDEERIIHEILSNPKLDREAALQKSILSMAALTVAAGVPMLYQSQEFGMDTARTIDENKLDWERLEQPEGQRLFNATQRLLWFRNTHPALRSDNFEVLALFENEKVLAVHRWNHEGDDVVAALNFSAEPQSIDLVFPQQDEWHEFIGKSTLNVETASTPVELQPYAAKIFAKWRNWDD